jgi:hypothetical protein
MDENDVLRIALTYAMQAKAMSRATNRLLLSAEQKTEFQKHYKETLIEESCLIAEKFGLSLDELNL